MNDVSAATSFVAIVYCVAVFVAKDTISVEPFAVKVATLPSLGVMLHVYPNASALESVTVKLLPPLTLVDDAVSLGEVEDEDDPPEEDEFTTVTSISKTAPLWRFTVTFAEPVD